MKKILLTMIFLVTFLMIGTTSALAVTNGTVKVGLRFGGSALFSANLENAVGSGYSFGYYDNSRNFVVLGATDQTAISMTADGTIYVPSGGSAAASAPSGTYAVIGAYRVQLGDAFDSYSAAAAAAAGYPGGYPAYLSDAYCVQIGSYETSAAAQAALSALGGSGSVVEAGSTGVLVTVTGTAQILFAFDCQGAQSLAVLPNGNGAAAATWFKGTKYNGGFQYDRITGGNLNVINVVGLEDYVRGVVPYEMSGGWPAEALKAQAICARTYVCSTTKHLSSYGFDVCNTTDCQVYNGTGNSSAAPTAVSDQAVSETAGKCLYSNGSLIEAVYFSSDGGATEDAANVWGGAVSYLIGKLDPYESTISIPNYTYTVAYTPAQLTWVLQNSGYSIGTIGNVFVSEQTKTGNVYKVTFVDTTGKTLTVKGEKCRSVFYSSTYGKSVRSMRFQITGGASANFYVNDASTQLSTLTGAYLISGSGTVSAYSGSAPYAVTSSGTSALSGGASSSSGAFTITGTGNGHNVGMSQYGAYAMAQKGLSCEDILNFYYTDVTIG